MKRRQLKAFGLKLKAFRVEAEFTQAALARLLGYQSSQPVSDIERGIYIAPDRTLVGWAEHCGIELGEMRRILLALREKELNDAHPDA